MNMYDTHTHALYLYIIKTLNNTWTNLLAICLSKTYRTIPAVVSIFQRNVAREIPPGLGEFNHHVGVKVLIWLVRFRVSVYNSYNDIWFFLFNVLVFWSLNPSLLKHRCFFGFLVGQHITTYHHHPRSGYPNSSNNWHRSRIRSTSSSSNLRRHGLLLRYFTRVVRI